MKNVFYFKFTFKNNSETCCKKLEDLFESLVISGITRIELKNGEFSLLAEENPKAWLKIWEKAWVLTEERLFVDNVCSWVWHYNYSNKEFDDDILSYCIHTGKGLYGEKTA